MLAALLANLPQETQPTGGGRTHEWYIIPSREDYDDYKKRAKKATEPAIKKAIRILKGAPSFAPDFVSDAVETAELYGEQPSQIMAVDWVQIEIMIAYYAFIDWRKKDEEDIATILLLI